MKTAMGMVMLSAALLPFGGKAHRQTENGNQAYREKAYEEALRAYTEAQVAAPEAPELHYDIGNVLYRLEDYVGAAEAYTRALLSAPESLGPRTSYNLGNALYRDERFEEAVKAYRRSLEAEAGDQDAKRNLELALRALEEQRQQQSQQEGGSEQDEGSDQQPSPQPQPQPSDEDSEQGQEPRPKPQQPGEMTAEEANRLLDSLAEQERETLKRRARMRTPEKVEAAEEDW